MFHFLFASCENFLAGSPLKEQLEQQIVYANASTFVVRISPKKTEMGTVVTGNEKKETKFKIHSVNQFKKDVETLFYAKLQAGQFHLC